MKFVKREKKIHCQRLRLEDAGEGGVGKAGYERRIPGEQKSAINARLPKTAPTDVMLTQVFYTCSLD